MHRRTHLELTVVTLFVAAGCDGATPRSARTSEGKGPAPSVTAPAPAPRETASISVMSYNLNYGVTPNAEMIAAIRDEDSDLVFLQETTEGWEEAIVEALGARYPHRAFRHCCIAGGLGVLSKTPIEPKDYVTPPEGGWFPSWRFLVDTPIGRIQALNVHLRPQVSRSGSFLGGVFVTPAIREEEIARYYAKLDQGVPTIVVGDFNENRGGRAIQYLEARGFSSAVVTAGSDDTWRWQTSVGEITEKLDHIVHDASFEVRGHRVVPRGSSDHLPVVATLVRR